MAKIGLTKLGLKIDTGVEILNFNEQEIEVKKYLPIAKKLELVSNVLGALIVNDKFYNPIKLDIYSWIFIMEEYTNINFTDKQKEDPAKLYDMLYSSGVIAAVAQAIPEAEYEVLRGYISAIIDRYYAFNNSAMGIIDNIVNNYDQMNLDTTKLEESIANPENLKLLKDVVTKLG